MSVLDGDLSDAFHTGSQSTIFTGFPLQARLDAEEVEPFLRSGDGSDFRDGERKLFGRVCRQDEVALLPERDLGDVAFVDFEDDSIVVEGCELEKDSAALDRCTDRLAQIATNDDRVERRLDSHAPELIIDQGDLSVCLIDLRSNDAHVRILVFGKRLLVLLSELFELAAPLVTLERHLPVVE